MPLGRTALVQGPFGSGKSTVGRTALAHWGSGVVLTAPGVEEVNSYTEYVGREGYFIRGFNDEDFLPSIGMWHADGHKKLLRVLHGLTMQCRWDLGLLAGAKEELKADYEKRFGEPRGEIRYKGLVLDTISGVGVLVVSAMQSTMHIEDAPAAQSPEGAQYFLGLQSKMEEMMRMLDSLKGYGMDIIACSHVREKKVPATSMAEVQGKTAWVPAIVGGFRDLLPRAFDVTFFSGVNQEVKLVEGRNDPKKPRYYLRWVTDGKKPTKSRVGPLASTVDIPNEWPYVSEAIDRALAARAEQGFDMRGIYSSEAGSA